MKHYKLTKVANGYVLKELSDGVEIDPMVIKAVETLQEVRDLDKEKIVATTFGGSHKLNIDDCDAIFGIKETRRPKVSEKYEDCEYGSIGELKGMCEMVRTSMYNYLSGRMTHESFLVFYQQYQTMLHEHGIIKVNDWNLDEERDDVYYNDDLEVDELKRMLPIETATDIIVAVNTLKDEYGFVEFFSV